MSVYEKTQGNAFFTHEFLKSLYEQELLEFDQQNAKMAMGDIDQIIATLDDRQCCGIDRQQDESSILLETQQVLKMASCIGNLFDLKTDFDHLSTF
jgi:predicted ATPase